MRAIAAMGRSYGRILDPEAAEKPGIARFFRLRAQPA
jgi:hypothetical protein